MNSDCQVPNIGFTFDTDTPRINLKSQSRYVTLIF